MKATVVPAQVTTVEDRIAGNLGISQILLLVAPVFAGSALFILMPPFFHSAMYKVALITMLTIICGLLAMRIKGTVVLFWLVVVLRYNLRPRYYVFNKRSLHGREDYPRTFLAELEDEPVVISRKVWEAAALTTADVMAVESIIANPAANLSFESNKKGRLYVRITEIKQEG